METRYCPSCGQDVALENVLEGTYLMTCCANCGLGLGVKLASADVVRRYQAGESMEERSSLGRVELSKRRMAIAPAIEKPTPPDPRSATPVPLGAQSATPGSSLESSSGHSLGGRSAGISAERSMESSMEISGERGGEGDLRQMRSVMIVEDSQFLRQIARDLLTERQLARDVVECPDGVAFIEAFTRATLAAQKPDLVVLDVRMPGMDGREVAFAMRAIESGLGVQRRTPILFFSAVLCDAEFKAQLQSIRNARYIRKTDGGDAHELGERIVTVLERLVGGRPAAG